MNESKPGVEHLLIGVTGSAAILDLPAYLVTLRTTFARDVRVIMTAPAAQLLPPATVALLCDQVLLDEPIAANRKPGHVELAEWADMFVILPASANTLGQAANGLATNLLTTTILAFPEPVVFCPNLNETMWGKKSVQRNLRTLAEDGHIVLEPVRTPAYEVGTGQMAYTLVLPEPDDLVQSLRAWS